MNRSIYKRLQQALPDIRAWIEGFVADHAASVVHLSELTGAPLRQCFPVEFLAGVNVVVIPKIIFPPVGSFGLPEFSKMEQMHLEGITFDTTFFVQAGAQSQSLYFHEIIHVVQWQHLGFDRFLLAYAANMIGRSYYENPLETIAYSLQREFEGGTLTENPISQIQAAADSAWSGVKEHFAS